MGVTIGLTGLLLTPIAVLSVGGTIGGGVYLQLSPGGRLPMRLAGIREKLVGLVKQNFRSKWRGTDDQH